MKSSTKDCRVKKVQRGKQKRLNNFYSYAFFAHVVLILITILITLTLSSLNIRWNELTPMVYESLGIDLHVTVDHPTKLNR